MSVQTPYEEKEKLTIKESRELLDTLIDETLNEEITNIDYREGKSVRNSVFRVQTKHHGNMIVRLSDSEEALDRYEKEAWCMGSVSELDVPVPKVVAAGNTVIPYAYSILEELPGISADQYVDTKKKAIEIWHKIGRFVRIIHKIDTKGFGLFFNWKSKHDSGFNDWRDYLNGYDIRIDRVIDIYENVMKFDKKKLEKIEYFIEKIKNWYVYPKLNHFDIGLRNVLINSDGAISGILDWEMARSLPAPYGDFAQVYMELLLKGEKESLDAFIKGYGFSKENFERIKEDAEAYTIIRMSNHLNYLNEVEAKGEIRKHKKVLANLSIFS